MKSPNFLKNYTIAELRDYVRGMGEQAFRADQLFDAMYAQGIEHIHDIATLPKALRETLEQETVMSAVRLQKIQESNDGTKKFLFELFDGRAIETVLIPSE
ncbi:MAG TPA: 23S rRNA (adenine(2503)-C(2))-methyltransferase RlmN, partial [Candidatus Kapabacteria bacterium]|nr:23S rRNA (adenine(2503)-C(2))-methyltransferase RlmN [Candidatus Kapabacteria bacterium]